ncbi:glycosyltransferase family 4 protein [Verrucomicrobia bacterium]|nr:glycosyltransferase family 4 protein [Verrucomicrobiota bacterium]
MRILFLTLFRITTLNERGIYTDLMREFSEKGHQVHIISPNERRFRQPTTVKRENGAFIINVRTLNYQKSSLFEKFISLVTLQSFFNNAIKKYLKGIKFDLIIYSTPPITLNSLIKRIKENSGAKCYLLLKDIFPQNAVDIELLKKNSLTHKYFKKKEKALYELSDHIGCMSNGNLKYLLKHNHWLKKKAEVNPNSIQVINRIKDRPLISEIKRKYEIPENKTIFIYGGNLGKPQGIEFLLSCIAHCSKIPNAYFLIVGSGTEYKKIQTWFVNHPSINAKLISAVPKKNFDEILSACHVGLIFLDPRFTIPNYPSRLLSYLEFKMPIIAATDKATDIGAIAQTNGYGFSCEPSDLNNFRQHVDYYCKNQSHVEVMGEKGFHYLCKNYTSEQSYKTIMKHF